MIEIAVKCVDKQIDGKAGVDIVSKANGEASKTEIVGAFKGLGAVVAQILQNLPPSVRDECMESMMDSVEENFK